MLSFDCLKAHDFDHEYARKVQFAYERDRRGKQRGLTVFQYAQLIARREACDQLENLLLFRDALNERIEYVPGEGGLYPWDLVQWIFSGYEYNYLDQLYKHGVLGEPQGGLVAIDWAAVVGVLTESRVSRSMVCNLLSL